MACTLSPPLTRLTTTLVICGAVERTLVEASTEAGGPLRTLPLVAIVPATVPVNRKSGDENSAVVLFAGKVKFTVRPPLEN
jgi:hypothetical protein